MDEREGGTLERDASAPDTALDGDDIVVLPDCEKGSRRSRPVLVGAATIVLLAIIGVAVLVTRGSSSKPRLETTAPISVPVVAKVHPTPTVPHKKPKPKGAATTVPATLPHTLVPAGNIVVPPPPPNTVPAPTAPTTVEPAAQYGAAVLQWAAPQNLVMGSGTTKTFTVTAHNPTPGTVTLSHPLSCTPRLDHSEVCAEVVQLITAQQSASAQYTIDARGIAAGRYTLRIEGVLTINVTVTGPTSPVPPG